MPVAEGLRAAKFTLMPCPGGMESRAPQLKGTGEGRWRTRMAGGHHGSAPPCSRPYVGTPASRGAGRVVPICAGVQTSAVPPGAFPPDNEPS